MSSFTKKKKAAQKSAQEQADYTAELEEISSRRQTIDVLLSCGNLMPDEEERLSELRKEITAKGAVLDQLSQKSSKAFCPFCLGRTKNPHLYLNTEKTGSSASGAENTETAYRCMPKFAGFQ